VNDVSTTILLVEDDAADAKLIQEALTGAGGSRFHVERVARLSEALDRLSGKDIEVIMLDLTLPDSQGLEVFDRVFEAAPNALIMVLSTANDEAIANQAVSVARMTI